MNYNKSNRVDYFKLLDQPFDNTRDTRFFFESKGHGEALSRLLFLAQDGNMGMGMLTGHIGCGKTMTRTVLHNRLDTQSYKVVSIENCFLDFDSLLLEIISQIKGERLQSSDLPDRYARLACFKKELSQGLAGSGRHLVVILDEAQHLSLSDLECVKGLTNIASEKANLSTFMLVGQPELRDKVRRLPQVDQRISLRYHLEALRPKETLYYLMYRMRVAGLKGAPPFTREALLMICRVSQGIPREINRICKLALDHAIANKKQKIDSAMIKMIFTDLCLHGGDFDSSGVLV